MKLASLKNARKDGRLVVVSRDLVFAADASVIAPTLLAAVEAWDACAPPLQALFRTASLSLAMGAPIVAVGVALLLVLECEKAFLRWRKDAGVQRLRRR